MAEALALSIRLTAENLASRELQRVRQDHAEASQAIESGSRRVTQATATTGREISQATRTVRALAGGLVAELNPALAQVVGSMSIVAGATRRFSATNAALAVTAAAVVTVLTGYIRTVSAVTEAQARLNVAVAAFDIASIRSGIVQTTTALEQFRLSAQTVWGEVANRMAQVARSLGLAADPIKDLMRQQEAFRELLPVEAARRQVETMLQRVQVVRQETAGLQEAAKARGDLAEFLRLHDLALRQLTLQEQTELEVLRQTIDLERRSIEQRRELQLSALAAMPGATAESMRSVVETARAELAVLLLLEPRLRAVIEERARGAREAAGAAGAKGILDLRLQELETLRQRVHLGETVLVTESELGRVKGADVEMTLRGLRVNEQNVRVLDEMIAALKAKVNLQQGDAALAQSAADTRARELALLQQAMTGLQMLRDLEVVRLEHQKLGADTGTRAALDLRQIESRRVFDLAAIEAQIELLTRRQRELAEVNAELSQADRNRLTILQLQGQLVQEQATGQTAAIRRTEALRADPMMGVREGLRTTVEEFTNLGQLMESGVRTMGQNMASNFRETFVAGVTGDFKKLQELPRLFALQVLNTFADVLGKLAAGSVLRTLGSAFGAAVPGAPGGGAGDIVSRLFGGGGGGGGGGATLPTGTVVTLPSGQTVTLGAPGAGGAGGVGVGDISSLLGVGQQVGIVPSGGAWFPGLQQLLATPTGIGAGFLGPSVLTIGGQAIPMTASELAIAEAIMGGVPSLGVSTTGLTLGAALGIAGGVAGLGLTVWSALQGPPTAMNIVTSAISGALSGAMIGTFIFPGIGTAIGAIAGAVIGGGAAAFGKGGKKRKPSASERSLAAGRAGAQALANAINAAQSLQDIADIFNRQWAPHGEVQLFTVKGGAFWWAGDWDDPPSHVFSADDFLDPEVVDNLVVQVGQTGVVPKDDQLTQGLKDKVRQLAQLESRKMFAFRDILAAPGMAGDIERTTFLPGFLRSQAAGKDIFTSISWLRQLGLSDDDIEAFLRELRRVDRDRSLGLLTPEEIAF